MIGFIIGVVCTTIFYQQQIKFERTRNQADMAITAMSSFNAGMRYQKLLEE